MPRVLSSGIDVLNAYKAVGTLRPITTKAQAMISNVIRGTERLAGGECGEMQALVLDCTAMIHHTDMQANTHEAAAVANSEASLPER